MKHTKPEGGFAAEQVLGRMKAVGIDVLFANGGTDFPSIIEAYARQAQSASLCRRRRLFHTKVSRSAWRMVIT